MDFLEQLGIRLGDLFAALVGTLFFLSFEKEMTAFRITTIAITGSVGTALITPMLALLIKHYFSIELPLFVHSGVSFVMGLVSIIVFQGLIVIVKKWKENPTFNFLKRWKS